MTVHIRAQQWGWRHSGRNAWALSGVDFTIERGERVLILGPSGAGKSTLLKAISGVLGGQDEGEELGSLTVNGQHPSQQPGRTGLMLQDPNANTIMSRVGDDLAFGCENLFVPPSQIWPRAAAALEAVGLNLPLDHSTEFLSGGQRQRLALAGILAMAPELLVLDEPTANLDPDGVVEVRDSVKRALDHSDATMVVVEHRVDIWLPLITRVIVLEPGGGVRADGDPQTVLSELGTELAAEGIWVPHLPVAVERNSSTPGQLLLESNDLLVGRHGQAVGTTHEVQVHAGESIVITGPNGAGKSTLALTLGGLLAPVAGDVTATPALRDGQKSSDPLKWRSRELVRRIGTVFQIPEQQFVTGSVRKELELGPKATGMSKSDINERVDRLLVALGLESLAEANPFTLSGGEQRRLSVATALATRPKILFLDEPTFGQDRRTWIELVQLMSELVSDGTTLVSISHDADLVRIMGDRIINVGLEQQERVHV
ncbi:ABC transporter ATP-binding protein [Micrococcoides hystricis]|uniref:ABC transporter ATP-binding protein n=1 Tax=Micrococcoides hystricis TaxID=1572761 RepID=A0ABV6P7P8_9MICC